MGATTDYRTYPATTGTPDAAVLASFREACEQERHWSGHAGYSGTVAEMTTVAAWHDLDLDGEQQAMGHIEDRHQKWDEAMAVSFRRDGQKFWVVGGWVSE